MKKKKEDALVLTPEAVKEIEVIRSESDPIILQAAEIAIVKDTESEARAAEFLKQIKIRIDIAEMARTKLVKPLRDHVKMIDAEFKKTTGPLEKADETVRCGMIAYRNSPAFKAAEERRKELEREGKRAAQEGDIDDLERISEEHRDASVAAPVKVETESGEARFRKIKRFEIVDLEKLPAAYWMPDEKKIKVAVDAGMVIDGVKTWTEEIPIII